MNINTTTMKKTLTLSACILAFCLSLHAQNTGPAIDPDGTVHFSLRAPDAEKVEVQGQFMAGTLSMAKGENGVWTASYKPAKADIYPYCYIVDGVQINDPSRNAEIFPNENFKSSILEMPNPDALYTVKNVPHGDVHYNTFYSRLLGEWRKAVVYTPAEYYSDPDKEYPVFYLISGTTDTEETWYKAGKANVILDNMIAAGDAEPMIVVMPYGYVNAGTPRPNTIQAADMYKIFSDELVQTVIPFIDSTYRTVRHKDGRAISGFSRGGGQALYTALSNPDKIGWLNVYSAYLTPEVMDRDFPEIKTICDSFKALDFCVGTKDFLYLDVVKNLEYFDAKGIEYEHDFNEGESHTWMHCRYALERSYRSLFKDIK